jgi:hypothetical protein
MMLFKKLWECEMNKYLYRIITLLALFSLFLSSCGADSDSPGGDGEEGQSIGENISEEVIDLPPIPEVRFGAGDAWFRPTDPTEIQLAAGKVQLFEFSAVW